MELGAQRGSRESNPPTFASAHQAEPPTGHARVAHKREVQRAYNGVERILA